MKKKDLAKKFNLSSAAFSLIIHNKPGVSDATRAYVIEELNKMGYGYMVEPITPPTASNVKVSEKGLQLCYLIFKDTGTITEQENPLALSILSIIEKQANYYGYRLLVIMADRSEQTAAQLNALTNMNVKGILVMASEMNPDDLQIFDSVSLPVVILDRNFPFQHINSVSIDNDLGCFQAIEYLYHLGHRKIGYLKSAARVYSFEERETGYRNALEYFGLRLDDRNIFSLPYNEMDAQISFSRILSGNPKLPTALVSDDDLITLGAVRALIQAGIKVPEDISVIGYNNRTSCTEIEPALTTIDIVEDTLAAEGIEALVRSIRCRETLDKPDRTFKVRVGTNLIERASASRLKTEDFSLP